MLHAEAPLLHHGRGIIQVLGAEMERLQRSKVDRAGIEEVGRESVLSDKNRRGVAGQGLVNQEGRIQRKLVLTAEAFEQRVIDAITAANHGVVHWRVGESKTRTKCCLV